MNIIMNMCQCSPFIDFEGATIIATKVVMVSPVYCVQKEPNEKYGFYILVENLNSRIQYTDISEQGAKDRRRDFLTDLKNSLIKQVK